jgi:hypothetical protein
MLFSLSPPPLFEPVAPSKRRFSPFDSHGPFFKIIHPDTWPQTLRTTVVGFVIAILLGLTRRPADRSARHGLRSVPESFPLILDKEIAALEPLEEHLSSND